MGGQDEFDFVIVGAGSAGCVLANRLSADPGTRVALIEAGGSDSNPWIHVPFAWGKLLTERMDDWGFVSEPVPGLDGRRVDCMRGKVLGGCSSVNAMAYVRGHPDDYDRWAEAGLAGWAHADLLPYFKRAEAWEGGESDTRGATGPLNVIGARSTDPLHEAYREAVLRADITWNEDFNRGDNAGIGLAQHTIRAGRRESGVTAYLAPARRRPNLVILTRAHVSHILFEGGRATGIACRRKGREGIVRARCEVIVSAGAIKSPQLLMLSGIGPADALRARGIKVRADLPGVGANLQDHIAAGLVYARSKPGPIHARMRLDRAARDVVRAYLFGTGPMSVLPTKYQVFLHSGLTEGAPDIQLLAGGATLGANWWLPGVRAPYADSFACSATALRPRSRGHIALQSADPEAPPRIEFGHFADPHDLAVVRTGLRRIREIVADSAFDPFRGAELSPGPDAGCDAALDAHIRRSARTVHHPAGTCRMGVDEGAVLDQALRVHGLEGLRVVDASAMPNLVSGNINAAVVVIAERAADLIAGVPPLPPVSKGGIPT